MPITLTSKGRVTIPKRIREAIGLLPGTPVEFLMHDSDTVLLRPASVSGGECDASKNRFEAARGKSDVPWRNDDLIRSLRDDN